jgi:hypothetical protein
MVKNLGHVSVSLNIVIRGSNFKTMRFRPSNTDFGLKLSANQIDDQNLKIISIPTHVLPSFFFSYGSMSCQLVKLNLTVEG